MSRRLITAVTTLVAIVSIALALPLGIAINNNHKEEFIRNLELNTVSTASVMSSQPYIDWAKTAAIAAVETGARVVVVDSELNLIIDSELSPLNRSFSRPEIVNALSGTLSSNIRYSITLATDLRYVAAPITQNYQVVGVVRLSLPENTVNATVFRSQLGLLVFVLLIIGVAASISLIIARSVSKPVDNLTKIIGQLESDLSIRADENSGPDEVKQAAKTLNQTTSRLEDLLKRTERVAEEASHHLRSPLTSIRLRLETIVDISADAEIKSHAEAALSETDRLANRISQVLALTKADSSSNRFVTEPLSELVRNQVQLLAPRWEEKNLDIKLDLQDCDVYVPIGVSSQIVNELISNAINYAHSKIEISLKAVNEMAELTISDDGIGLPDKETANQIFDRFYRAKNAVPGGSGLGLALVKESAISAGGNAWVNQETNKTGFSLTVTLPLSQQ